MSFQILSLLAICFGSVLSGYCQNFKQFESLTGKADSAKNAKNYSLSEKYYEQAMQLAENQKPEFFGGIYLTMASVYSLNHEKEKALNYLEKSFLTYNAKKNRNPASVSDMTGDSEWEFIRNERRFLTLLKDSYPHAPIDILNAREISYAELLRIIEYLNDDPNSKIGAEIRGKNIYWKKEKGSYAFNETSLPLPNLRARLRFINCTFQLNFVWNNRGEEQLRPYTRMDLMGCKFLGRFYLDDVNFVYPPYIRETTFSDDLFISLNLSPEKEESTFLFSNCSFKLAYINFNTKAPINIVISDNSGSDSSDFRIDCNNVSLTRIEHNGLEKKNIELSFSETGFLMFKNNKFNNIKLFRTIIQSEFDLQNTEIVGKFLMFKSSFGGDPSNNIDWINLKDFHLGLLVDPDRNINTDPDKGVIEFNRIANFKLNSGEDLADISESRNFNELMGLYSLFLNLYKTKNNLEPYNACFIAVKELQSKRLQFLYESNKTFETYFRWKLSHLMRFYVRYGTDPARAIVISIYIIFWFGVFFFFFPSDWDATSKTKLIQNFKDFIQKNEKGYVIPFFVLIGGFALSLINALTLSINAFVTLGFGNIPTHGIARYVCVIEGFMGWFLLSIFTVALINQVL
jgi:hypothetical protein